MMNALHWITGASLAVAVCAIVLGLVLRLMIVTVGKTGTALVTLIVLVASAWAGWSWLIHSDHLALQIVGWLVPVALAALATWGGYWLVLWWRTTPRQTVEASK